MVVLSIVRVDVRSHYVHDRYKIVPVILEAVPVSLNGVPGPKPGVHRFVNIVHGRSSHIGYCSWSFTLCSWPFQVVPITLDAVPVRLDSVPGLKQGIPGLVNIVNGSYNSCWSLFVFVHVVYMTVPGRSTFFGRRSSSFRQRSRSKTSCSWAYWHYSRSFKSYSSRSWSFPLCLNGLERCPK